MLWGGSISNILCKVEWHEEDDPAFPFLQNWVVHEFLTLNVNMFISEIEDIKDNFVYCDNDIEKERTEYHIKVLEEYLALVEFDKKNLDGK